MSLDIELIMRILFIRRSVFCSEADFQLEFAATVRAIYPEAFVRCEFPLFYGNETNKKQQKNIYIDILVVLNKVAYPIELKYKTKGFVLSEKCGSNFAYSLKDQAAQDYGRYDYIIDISRLEKIGDYKLYNNRCEIKSFKEIFNNYVGYAIFLTNDLSYINQSTRQEEPSYINFSIHHNRYIDSSQMPLEWKIVDDKKRQTLKKDNRDSPINLLGSYHFQWKTCDANFSIEKDNNGERFYLFDQKNKTKQENSGKNFVYLYSEFDSKL